MKERSCRTVVAHLALAAVALATQPARAADPTTTECLSAYEGSIKLRELHKLGDARMRLLLCSAASCPGEIRTECARHLPEVETAVPTIVFEAKDASGNDIAAVAVTMDGARLADRLDGTSIALDPGEHVFVFQAGAGPKVEKRLVIHEGEKNRRERIVVSTSGSGSAPVPPDTTSASPSPSPTAAEAPKALASTSSWSTGRTLAVVSGGVGVVGIALGAIFGGVAASKWSQAKSDCGTGCAPDAAAQGEKSSASSLATVSTVGFVVGGVGLAGGVVLWFVAPSVGTVQIAPAVGGGTTGLRLQGQF